MRHGTALLAALVLALAPGQAGPASAADPFYEGLMETGFSAHARGDYATAAEDLRLASFGLLEEPEKLAECLTYLAVAQAETADVPAFSRTVDRLLEVERRFQAFSQLTLDAALRRTLEAHLLASIPFEVLERSVVFRDVGRHKRQAELQEMPSAERREELEGRLAAEPDYLPWRLLLGELELAEGNYEAAWSAAEMLLQQAPEMARTRCLRGRSGAALGLCEQALLDLEACGAPLDATLLAQRLRCHLALRDFDAASGVLAQVSANDRQRQPFRQLAKDLDHERKEAAKALAAAMKAAAAPDTEAPAADPASVPTPGTPAAMAAGAPQAAAAAEVPTEEPPAPAPNPESPPVAAPPPPAAAPPQVPPAADDDLRAELERLEALAATRSRVELEAVFASARALADAEPRLAEPQRLAALLAYRLSRWQDVVTYSRRTGEPETPDTEFYLSVALYETGDQAAAREMLERCLSKLEPTEFVRGYAEKILHGE